MHAAGAQFIAAFSDPCCCLLAPFYLLTPHCRCAQPTIPINSIMFAASMTRAGRRFATASACSHLRPTLPGAYREPTELWHHDQRAEAPSDVEVNVADV